MKLKEWGIKTEKWETWHAWESKERTLGVTRKIKELSCTEMKLKEWEIKTEE